MKETEKSVPETMNEYEVSCLLASEESLDGLKELLEKNDAVILQASAFNSIELAYQIKKRTHAFFGFITISSSPEKIADIRNALSFYEPLIRFLIITPPIQSVLKPKRVAQTTGPQESQTTKSNGSESLSNEALEQKLEEILK
ncbi:MAG: hypothetical protein COU07_02130 [Candidatus Harrisonbacteria bacterium CG10_big_fil_rev_8_21_14_0_10_40_38]|uniref:Small ribosomal subunit protein bS6 n=1 Tax=Candidatus Harrisonbacteria bacterium CG10_big_fil_rev_8_21_14_0_10_40_38 TaxID=1974583 RepID=A0A2H0US54_9BACT|nr:MAG: hypothetical protein COU07_02130 [Candidatus Harrisonbacteria bacterium CG10_big_fil_rev_8_21_14_0_10_40_38]